MTEQSPFSLRRFETENRHLYYLPRDLFAKLEGRRSTYLIGSRGTGKTTLLKALHWDEQLNNRELIDKLTELGVGRGYIGVYMRMPQTMADVFDEWIPNAAEHFRAAVFCLYLDFMWVQAACDAFSHLVLAKRLRASSKAEYRLTDVLLERYPELLRDISVTRPLSVKGFGSLLYRKRRAMEGWAYSALDMPVEEIEKTFPVAQIGEFGRTAALELARLCRHCSTDQEEWHFKICLDETECFTPFQQRALNTAVRLVQAPMSYVVSYVRLVDVTSTFTRGISLQDADREVVPLDELSDAEFTEFAEGVATVRLQKLSPGSPQFSTRNVFGSMDINELLFGILKTSASPEAHRFLKAAGVLADTPFYTETWERASTSPPIYQAYILDRLGLTLPSPQSPQWERRRQDSAEIRKRMVAAYLCICKELKTQVKYAGAEMILQMSDRCIRDYLSQLDSLFQILKTTSADFANMRASLNDQDTALTEASNRKKETIPKSEIGSPIETLRLIDSLGQLTARLQTATKDMKSLRSPERGLFVLACDNSSTELLQAVRLITDAADAGFLKMFVSEDRTIKFRIHCSLAAAYGMSYRGAYYQCILKQGDLIPLYRESDAGVRAQRVAQLSDLLLRDEAPLPLFEGAE
jgi:hypothetical protein